jgi:hypothetical protein
VHQAGQDVAVLRGRVMDASRTRLVHSAPPCGGRGRRQQWAAEGEPAAGSDGSDGGGGGEIGSEWLGEGSGGEGRGRAAARGAAAREAVEREGGEAEEDGSSMEVARRASCIPLFL